MNIEGSVALVTGANRRLGAAYIRALLDRGAAKVYAAVRRPETVTESGLVPVRLDLTDRSSIAEAALSRSFAVEAGQPEVLADETSRHVRAARSGPLAGLYPSLASSAA